MAASQRKRKRLAQAADLAFFGNLFTSIAEEMGASLVRSAYSSNIKERRDCSCALFDGQGRLVAQAAHIPVHLGAMPMSVRAALQAFETLDPGDAILLNDPFAGGTHLPDLTVVTPVFDSASGAGVQRKAKPNAFLASRAHHADVGGMTPGSLPLSSEIYQEGLRLPALKLREQGRLNRAVMKILRANSRTPAERVGDMRAQLAAHDLGDARLREILKHNSAARIREQMRALMDYGRRLMEAFISKMPNGAYTFEDRLDDDGLSDTPIKIRAQVTVRGRRAVVDFSGSAAACAGNLNAVEPVTLSAVYYCFLALLVTHAAAESEALEPPLNAGCFAPITIKAPPGTIVNAAAPHAVACGNLETSQRIVDVVFGALSKVLPALVPAASQGTMNNVAVGGVDPRTGQPFAYYETIAGGMGARPQRDGLSGVQVHMTNTLNTPAEALEFTFPMRVERYELRNASAGRGRQCGGHGLRRDLRVLCDCTGTLLSDRRRRGPYGLRGGKPGRRGKNTLIRQGRRRRLPGKTHLQLTAGDILSVETPGGGGWGKQLS